VIRIGLADLRLRERLRIQAIRDPLTGLFNRQYLDETLPRECQLAERRQSPLSVAMLDIDHFKQVNDRYGHEAGDEVLRAVGGLLRTAVRSSDIACRYGGEEFVLVLLDADLRAAESRLEQIRCDVKRMQCIHRGRTLPSIALSAGVSEFPMHGRTPGEILRAADEAMYAAKHAGRDRIVRSESERSALQDVFP
jgi:diguanylate cyclase (GGDEF)-like protein